MAVDENIFASSVPKGNKRVARWLIPIFVVILLIIVGYYAYGLMQKPKVTYLTMPVNRGSISDTVQATGTVKPQHEADLNFKESVVLKELHVKEGDHVKAGQLLAVQDDVTLRAQVEQANSQYVQATYKEEQAEIEYEKAQETLEKQEALYNAGALSKSDYEQAQNDYRIAELNLKTAKAQTQAAAASLQLAGEALEKARMTAPFSGIITQVNGEVGVATASGSTPFIHLIGDELMIEAQVNEVDIGKVKVGQDVEFTATSYPDISFKGKVQRIACQAQTVNNIQIYYVEIGVNDPNHKLLPGMSVTANIIVNRKNDVVTVPTLAFSYAQTYLREHPEALAGAGSDGSKNASSKPSGSQRTRTGRQGLPGQGANAGVRQVVVLENGKPVLKRVLTGLSDRQNTEVIKGLTPGERVVIGTNSVNADNEGTNVGSSGSQRSRSSSPFSGPMMRGGRNGN